MRRRFTQSERAALLLASHGRCAICGGALGTDWHADHREPFSHGGETSVINGQAVCRKCNLRKGDRVGEIVKPSWLQPRKWQVEFFDRFWEAFEAGRTDFLLEACPGAGKTVAAALVATHAFQRNRARRLIVIVPTESLKKQWATEFGHFGLQLSWTWEPDQELAADFHGVVICYQTLVSAPLMVQRLCSVPTLVIGDEWHHVAEQRAFGTQAEIGLRRVVARLLLSGTPFRSDNNPIPYIRYEPDDKGQLKSKPDYRFGYGQALQAGGVIRPVVFALFDGMQSWWDGQWHEKRLSEALSRRDESVALRAAIAISGKWLPGVLREADQALTTIRGDGHPDAGALVVCDDQDHARAIAKELQRITGEPAALVISDEPMASDLIARFADGRQRWIVSVRMVSEGVDIKRLRVAVLASLSRTDLSVRQFVGRVLRHIGLGPDVDETACIYIPSIKTLIEICQEIATERNHALSQPGEGGGEHVPGVPDRPTLTLGPNTAPEHAGFIVDEGRRLEASVFEELRADPGLKGVADAVLARVAGKVLARTTTPATAPPQARQPATAAPLLHDRKKALRDGCKTMVAVYVRSLGGEPQLYSSVNNWLNRKVGAATITACTEEQLQERLRLIQGLLGGGSLDDSADQRRG